MEDLGITEILDKILSIYDSIRLFSISKVQLGSMVKLCCMDN